MQCYYSRHRILTLWSLHSMFKRAKAILLLFASVGNGNGGTVISSIFLGIAD